MPKLENPWHYSELGFEMKEIVKEEKCTEYNLNLVLYELQCNGIQEAKEVLS